LGFGSLNRLADVVFAQLLGPPAPDQLRTEEEARFWAEHELGDEMLDRMRPLDDDVLPPARRRATPVSVRFDEDILRRLKTLADRRGTRYQTLLKQFVAERLYEEERRAGLI
jgi:predicted DNA binding CopG/RHH family protein